MVGERMVSGPAARSPAAWWRPADDLGRAALALALAALALAAPARGQLAAEADGPSQGAGQVVPYKTFYVTRACEWKSSLFVPKSNDIHFAQAPGEAPEPADGPERRTMLSTDSRALVLALPPAGQLGAAFAGYEPACSIRLIVPRNMRILAKLSSRRLHFGQQQLLEDQQRGRRQLWLNVSQAPFAETEQRSVETPANVLALRFLLDRFASRETRLQVVLTAFQTLSENSDLSELAQPRHQFICDQQRLISANLACDGFRNCQDGHDEEPGTCAALRAGQGPPAAPEQPPGEPHHKEPEAAGLWAWLQRAAGAGEAHSLAGFLAGFLLVLGLLSACTCCLCLARLVRRRRLRPPKGLGEEAAEAERLASQQNAENLARSERLSPARPILKKPPPPPPPQPAQRGAIASSLTQPHRSPIHFRPTPAKRLARPSRPPPLAPAGDTTSSVTGSKRLTTYHYSAGSLHLSQAQLEGLARERPPPPPTPPGGPRPNQRRPPSSSPQSSLI